MAIAFAAGETPIPGPSRTEDTIWREITHGADPPKTDHESHTTTDHETIRRWAEARCARPSTVKGTADKGEEAGLLRLDFPGYRGEERLEEISWEDFFQKFDEANLAFVYQEHTADGKESHFCKFIRRES